jgi:hypothetical protein
MYSTVRIYLCTGQLVYQIFFKSPAHVISMYGFARKLGYLLELPMLDLKKSTVVESVGEPAYKSGPALSPSIWYIQTVILYFKLKRRLPSWTGITGPFKLLLPRSHYSGSTAHKGKMSPMFIRNSATKHQIAELLGPSAWTQPILVRSSESAISRVLMNFADIKLVTTHQSLFRITRCSSIPAHAVSEQRA